MAKIYKGDVGTSLKVTVGTDLTDASVTKLNVLKPGSSSVTEWTATIDDAQNGILEYVAIAGDFSTKGIYVLQAYVEFTGGEKLSGETTKFEVFDSFS